VLALALGGTTVAVGRNHRQSSSAERSHQG
jgi:hypothetical protein